MSYGPRDAACQRRVEVVVVSSTGGVPDRANRWTQLPQGAGWGIRPSPRPTRLCRRCRRTPATLYGASEVRRHPSPRKRRLQLCRLPTRTRAVATGTSLQGRTSGRAAPVRGRAVFGLYAATSETNSGSARTCFTSIRPRPRFKARRISAGKG